VSDPVVVCDLDGVVWRGELAVGGSADAIATLRAAGIHVAFLTNNSSNPVGHVVERLAACGVAAEPADVLTSAQAAASLLAEGLPAGARVLACAGAGVREALAAAGYVVVEDGAAEAVVVGWHREFDFERLDRAAQAVRGGARFVATNTDPTYPDARRVLPGAGAIVAAVATAAGRAPEVAGKPHRATAELVRARVGATGVLVGDRPSTDGAMAAVLGWPFGLVLSGIGGHDPAEPIPDPAPRFVGADLRALAPALVEHARAAAAGPGTSSAPR